MSSIFPVVSELSAGWLAACATVVTFATGMSLFWALGVWRWFRQGQSDNTDLPQVSVLVAGRNEETYLGRCLAALLNQDYPADRLQVVFVDDHSTDCTKSLADEASSESCGRLIVVSAPECPVGVGPKKNALSSALKYATGDILLFTDADCLVSSGWVRTMLSSYDADTGAVTGPVLPTRGVGFANLLLHLERILISYTSASAVGWGHPASASGGNFSYRRAALDRLGGISHLEVASGDDDLMAQAIARDGWKVRFALGAEAIVEHLRKPTFRQEFNSTIRHQSTTRYYPVGWRIAYFLSILSHISLTALLIASVWMPALLVVLPGTFVLRILIEGTAARSFCRRFAVRLSAVKILIAELFLPFYLIARACLSFLPSFTWHTRTHRASAARTAPPA